MKFWSSIKRKIAAVAVRSTFRDPDEWLMEWFTGGKTVSGERVGYATSLKVAAVWACVRNISEDEAKIPLITYRRLTRGKERATEHPIYRLLHDAPNEDQSAFDWRSTLTQHALLQGNGYSEIIRDGGGNVASLTEPIDPARVTPIRVGGKLFYRVTNGSDPDTTLSQDRMFHLKGMGDGITGYSVIRFARESFGASLAADKFAAAFFGNGLNAQGLLEHPGKLSDTAIAHLRKDLADIHSGADKAHKPLILEEGMKYNKLSITPEDAQFLESRVFHVVDVCRWFRMPPHKVAELSRATFSNIEQQSIEYVGDTLMPWFKRWEQEISRKLLRTSERTVFFAEHLIDGLLRADIKSRYDAYQVARQNGWMNSNDIRELENMNPIEGDIGEAYLVNGNMMTIKRAMTQEPAPAATPPSSPPKRDIHGNDSDEYRFSAHAKLLTAAFQRVLNLEIDRASAASKKGRLSEWSAKFYGDHVAHVESAIKDICEAIGSHFQPQNGSRELFLHEIRSICEDHVSRSQAEVLDDNHLSKWQGGERAQRQASEAIKRLIQSVSNNGN